MIQKCEVTGDRKENSNFRGNCQWHGEHAMTIETTCPMCGASVIVLALEGDHHITIDTTARRAPVAMRGRVEPRCLVHPVHADICPGAPPEASDG